MNTLLVQLLNREKTLWSPLVFQRGFFQKHCPFIRLTSGEYVIKYIRNDGVKPKLPRTRERGEWKPLRRAFGRAAPEFPVMSGTGSPLSDERVSSPGGNQGGTTERALRP